MNILSVVRGLAASAAVAWSITVPPALAQQPAPLPEGVPAAANYIPYGLPISLEMARTAAEAALAEAAIRDWPIAVAVVSPSGILIYFAMMDDTQLISPDIAISKARTAAMFRRGTDVFATLMANGQAFPATLHPTLVASPGGLPIVVDGLLIGGIGCSGVAGPQDAVACQAGIDALTR